MSHAIKILIVEDDQQDVDLLEYELKKGGLDYVSEVVKTEQNYSNSLRNFMPDIVLSDYSLPAFDGDAAFRIRQKLAPDIPFIFVSGMIGEEKSIEYIKNGVTDYVLKDKLFTLTTKVKRAVTESEERQEKNRTEQARVQSERQLARAQQVAHMGSWELDFNTHFVLLSDEACRIIGLKAGINHQSVDEWLSFIHPDDAVLIKNKLEEALVSQTDSNFNFRFVRTDGKKRFGYIEWKVEFEIEKNPVRLYGIFQDITDQKDNKEKIDKLNRLYAFISQVNQNIVRVVDEKTLFHNSCEIACEFGKFRMAWIGMFNVPNKKITLVDHCGILAEDFDIFLNAPCEPDGPQNHVLQSGTYYVSNNIVDEPKLNNWKRLAAQRNICSCIILPIKRSEKIIGTFNLYSSDRDFFDKKEIALLEEVVSDISFALDLFEKTKRHKEIEELLIKNEKQFRHTLDSMFEGIQIHDFEWRYVYVNDALVKYSTYSREELIGHTLMEKYPGVEQTDVYKAMQRAMQERVSEHIVSEFNFPNGKGTYFEISIDPIPEGIFVVSVDRSEERRAKEKEDFDQNNLKALINNTADMIWSVDRDFNLITANLAFDEMVKLMSGSIITKGSTVLGSFFNERQLNRFTNNYERAFSGETFTEIEYAELPIDIWSEISYYPIYKEATIVGTACFSRNITKQQKTENHLRLLESVVTHTTDAVLITEAMPIDMPGPRIVYVNQAFTKMTGYKAEEVMGETPRLMQGAKTDRHQLDKIRDALVNRQNIEVEIVNYKKNGDEFWNNFAIVEVTDKDGVPTHCVSVQRDVTSRRKSEEITLQRLEKLVEERTLELNEALKKEKDLVELKNKFVSIASHEFRTPLSTISFAAESIRNYFHQLTAEEIQRKLIKIEDQASHMTNLLEDILTLGKSEAGKIKVKRISIDLKEFIDTLIEEVRATIKGKREINFTFSCVSHKVNADDKLLRNVINNLLTNAIKFSGPDKPVKITVSDFEGEILIEVVDQGIGIEESELASIFESFQRGSNASAVQGTGLGLSILKKAVELMGGSIEVKSTLNEGSAFKVKIPIK